MSALPLVTQSKAPPYAVPPGAAVRPRGSRRTAESRPRDETARRPPGAHARPPSRPRRRYQCGHEYAALRSGHRRKHYCGLKAGSRGAPQWVLERACRCCRAPDRGRAATGAGTHDQDRHTGAGGIARLGTACTLRRFGLWPRTFPGVGPRKWASSSPTRQHRSCATSDQPVDVTANLASSVAAASPGGTTRLCLACAACLWASRAVELRRAP
jgi:hypothetical protein